MLGKPFDLEVALEGAQLVTHLGDEVTEFHWFMSAQGNKVLAVIKGRIERFNTDGHGTDSVMNDPLFLRIAATEKVGYINIFESGGTTVIFETEKEAISAAMYSNDSASIVAKAARVEWEE